MQARDKFFAALATFRAQAALAQNEDSPAVIDVGETLDAHAMNMVRKAFTTCAQQGRWNYVLDLSQVNAVDSSGLGMLVSALRSIHDVGGQVGLVADSLKLQRILELCARTRNCKIFTQVSEAVAALTPLGLPETAA